MDHSSHSRDMMFCHECDNEWYRDEFGLGCPECGSDFTEIIENGHDPRDEMMDEVPELQPPQGPLHNHYPWANSDAPDPEEDDISNMQWQQTGPNSITGRATINRTVSPHELLGARQGQNTGNPAMDGFASILGNILGARPPPGWQQQPQGHQYQTEQNRGSDGPQPAPGSRPPNEGMPNVHVRVGGGNGFTWTMRTSTLNPRDANNAQPRGQNFDELPNLLQQMFGGPHDAHNGMPGQHAPHGQADNPFANMGPLAGLFADLFDPANMRHGDAVYSQEALDRIISQMMEQNASGNAPGPASAEAIASLPKRSINQADLGETGKAECSICMDEVNIGDKVLELPCHHWFHGDCVKAWLAEHDTCPQCRAGIMPKEEANGQRSRRPDEAPHHDQMWGQGEGTRSSPIDLADSPTRQRRRSSARSHGSSAGPSSRPRPSSRTGSTDGLFNRMRSAFGGGGGN